MTKAPHRFGSPVSVAANGRLAEAAHLQAIEGNPLTAEEISMFEMFEREGRGRIGPAACLDASRRSNTSDRETITRRIRRAVM